MPDVFYKAVIESQAEGGFTAYVPGLPGCVSEGETYEEALANIREALELYLEVQQDRGGDLIPYHTKDLKKGTLHQIIKGTGVSIEAFLKHM